MNRFRANLHPAFFNALRSNYSGIENRSEGADENKKNKKTEEKELNLAQQQKEKEVAEEIKSRREEEVILETNIRRNNDVLASLIETKEEAKQTEEEVAKQLETQLKQLAKNKKIDFPWTDNEWKCSRAEKRLATASARVFQQLLDKGKLQEMIEKCKSQGGELTKEDAESWGKDLGINSKAKDIQNFYKAYQEYQNPQSEFQHLKNLMGFFCESGFEDVDGLANAMRQRSKKISKKERNEKAKELYHEELKQSEYGHQYYEYVDQNGKPRPKDWKERASFEVVKDRLGKGGLSKTDKMLTLLGDFNLDGEVNSGDVGYKTGAQLADVFRRTVASEHLRNSQFNDDKAVQNLIAYANKYELGISNINNIDGLYEWMIDDKKGYENTKLLQNFLRNLPIELGDVLKNGKDAGQESLESISSALNLEAEEKERAEDAAKQKSKDFVKQYENLLKERVTDAVQRANITQQLLSQLPGILMQEAKGMKEGLGIGTSIPLSEVVKGLSLGFNLGVDKDGNPHFGIYGARDRNFLLGKGFDMSTGANIGVKDFMIPCGSIFAELGYDISEEKRKKTLDAIGINRISLGANCTMYGPIFSWGVSAGFEKNDKGGIEKGAKNINNKVRDDAGKFIDAIKNKEEGMTDMQALKSELQKSFPDAHDEELDKASRSILQIVSQIKIDEKTTKEIAAQIVADVYTEMWRNEAISGIADNKRKLSGGKVGIQFYAGFYPTLTLVAKFTKYYNARTNETEHSRIARIDAQVNGVGNELVNLGELKEIGEAQVKQINEILKRYGAKYYLIYQEGQNGKPGHILVPASVVNGIGINIRVSENMKNYVQNPGIKTLGGPRYQFPANATYRLLQETGGNQRSLTLNIGSDKSAVSDIMISDAEGMKKLLGKNELKSGKKLEFKDPTTHLIEYKSNIDSLFTSDIIEGLKTIDSSDWRYFSKFMKTKKDAVINFGEMVSALKDVLKDSKYRNIVKSLDNSSQEDQQLIIDRIMAISAYANVHDKSGLEKNIRMRGDYYRKETMKGPNSQSIFNRLKTKRDDILSDIEDESNYNSEFKPNLLGATAFYNRYNKEKGLALTGIGATNVLGGITKKLEGDDEKEAKKWFLGGNNEAGNYVPGVLSKEKSPAEWANLRRVLNEKLPTGVNLDDGKLKDLITGKEIELDISEKKVKVKLEDVKYVFYLMGECANESVGMELGNLIVQEQQEVDVYRQGELYLNDGEGGNSVEVSRKDRAVGISFQKKKREEKKKEEKPNYTDGSDPSDGQGPDSTEPEQDGEPIDPDGSNPSDGNPNGGDTEGDNVWTEGGKNGGDSPDVDASSQGDL